LKRLKVLLLLISDEGNDVCINVYTCSAANYLTSYLRAKRHIVTTITKGAEELKKLDFKTIEWFKPDIIGINFISPELAKGFTEIKEEHPNLLICYGIGMPVINGEDILKGFPFIDYVCYGEGELTWENLLKRLESGEGLDNVKGLVYRKDGEVIKNGPEDLIDINSLPFIDITFPPFYEPETCIKVIIETSRGCTNNCSFCSMRHAQRKYRAKDVGTVVDEIEHMTKAYYIYDFQFSDLSFEDPNPKRLTALLQEIVNRDLNISFEANFRPNFIKKVTPEISDLLIKSRLYGAFIGIETANEDDLRLYHKGSTIEDAGSVISYFRDMGVHVNIGFIMFNPYSTIERLRQNVKFLEQYGLADFSTIRSILIDADGMPIHDRIMQDDIPLVGEKKFMDKNVGELYRFIHHYIHIKKHLGETADAYQEALGFLKTISHDIITAKRREQPEVQDALIQHYKKMLALTFSISAYICRWFNRLLDLAESGFDIKEAVEISANYMNSDLIKEANQMITDEFDKAHKVLFPEVILKQEIQKYGGNLCLK